MKLKLKRYLAGLVLLVQIAAVAAVVKGELFTFSVPKGWRADDLVIGYGLSKVGMANVIVSPSTRTQLSVEEIKSTLDEYVPDVAVKGEPQEFDGFGTYSKAKRFEWHGNHAQFGKYFAFWITVPYGENAADVSQPDANNALHISGVVKDDSESEKMLQEIGKSLQLTISKRLGVTRALWPYKKFKSASRQEQVAYLEFLRQTVSEIEIRGPALGSYTNAENTQNIFNQLLECLISKAYADTQTPCVFAGTMSYLVKKDDKMVCKQPPSSKCSAPTSVECNRALFQLKGGGSVCVEPSSSATKSCISKSTASPGEISNLMSESEFNSLTSSLAKYCKGEPLGFQANVCQNLMSRYDALADKIKSHSKLDSPIEITASYCNRDGSFSFAINQKNRNIPTRFYTVDLGPQYDPTKTDYAKALSFKPSIKYRENLEGSQDQYDTQLSSNFSSALNSNIGMFDTAAHRYIEDKLPDTTGFNPILLGLVKPTASNPKPRRFDSVAGISTHWAFSGRKEAASEPARQAQVDAAIKKLNSNFLSCKDPVNPMVLNAVVESLGKALNTRTSSDYNKSHRQELQNYNSGSQTE